MIRFRVCSLFILSLAAPCFASDETEYYTRAESFSSSDGAPLTAYLNRLVGPAPKRGSYAISRNNIEFGMAWTSWEFSFYHRNDYNLGYDPETLDFAYKNTNKISIPLDQNYTVSVDANQYQITGIKLGHEFSITKSISLWAAGSYIHATECVSGYLGKAEDGSGGEVSKSRVQLPFSDKFRIDLNGNLHTDYYFTHDPLFQRDVNPPTGQGYTFDLGANWQVLPNLMVEFKVSDALSEIRWDGLAHTTADATSDHFVEDENGVWQARPSYSGLGIEESFSQKLTKRTQLKTTYSKGSYSFAYEYDDMGLADFHRATVGYQFNQNWGLKGSLDLQRSTIGLSLLTTHGDFFIAFDDLSIDNAHNLGFGWAYHHPI